MALLKTFANDADAGYGFEWLRALLELDHQEGVFGVTDFKVVPAGAGGNRVDVMAGMALVKGDSGLAALGLTQGLYLQINDALIANAVTFDPGGAQPRLDQVVLEVNDSSDLGSAGELPRVYILKGAEVAGTTLDNGYTNGSAAALPNNTFRLADRLAPAGTNTLNVLDLRDRRKRARGARAKCQGSGAGNYTTSSLTFVAIDATNLSMRVELSGAPIGVRWHNRQTNANVAQNVYRLTMDAAAFADDLAHIIAIAGNGFSQDETAIGTPAAGSHLFGVQWSVSVGTATLINSSATDSPQLVLEEDVRPYATNN